MALESLGLPLNEERVAILVGPNGSGKSNFLKKVAIEARHFRDVVVVSNTVNDRFAGMRGLNRLSSGRGGQSPKSVIKQAVAKTIDDGSSLFYQIGSILQYCGYSPRFGFRISPGRKADASSWTSAVGTQDLEIAREFLDRYRRREIIWVDQYGSHMEFSMGREFASVLRNEELLVRERLLSKPTEVFLAKGERTIELKSASSGELSLISSLVYLITTARSNPLVLIDEPENSLHPLWQRDYIARVLAALEYRSASIVVATHAPLVVTGALSTFKGLVSVFQMHTERPVPLQLDTALDAGASIEEVLWRAFEVITPANHFVSEELMDLVTKLERREIDKQQALEVVDAMHKESFDDRQRGFLNAVQDLIEKIDREKGEGRSKNA